MKNESLINDAAVQAIKDSEKTQILKVGSREFTTRPVFEPPRNPVAATVKLHTLDGLADFINFDAEQLDKGLAVHVVDEETVNVVSGLYGDFEQRAIYATADADPSAFNFGTFMDSETFTISLQSLFVPTEELSAVLRVVGNIKEENVRQTGDDGVTQTIIARAGIAKVDEVEVPNPVTLRPYRTFREVEQPASKFILRMRQGRDGQLPSCALFEADGGRWKLEAIGNVKEYLAAKLGETPVIA